MKESRKRIRKPLAVAAIVVVLLSMSAVVFGQEIVSYVRTAMLGQHIAFVTGPELTDEEIADRQEEMQRMVDAGELEIVTMDNWVQPDWLTFTDVAEAKSHFVTDVMLPTYAPDGFEFDHIHFFVETLEELEQFGANFYMTVLFSNASGQEIRIQIRYVTEETGFTAGASPDMRTMEINGHEAVVDGNAVNLMVGDVLYIFFGMGIVDTAELIAMAESLN